jgi:hypothetical protein
LPVRALLSVRAADVPALPKPYRWTFRTKLALAAEMVRGLMAWLGHTGKVGGLAVDGAYAKRPFLRPVSARSVVVVSRLRQDAHLTTLPPWSVGRGGTASLARG